MQFPTPDTASPEDLTRYYSNNPYEVLGVTPASTFDQVKEAMKRLRSKFHPDKNDTGGIRDVEKAKQIFQNIMHAFNTIRHSAVFNSTTDEEFSETDNEWDPVKDAYHEKVTINGVEIWIDLLGKAYGSIFEIYFPGNHEVIPINKDPKLAKRVFEFAKRLAEEGKDENQIHDILYSMNLETIRDLLEKTGDLTS